ncbi:hypothetical protein ACFPFX_09195 [Streptomyces mauvecolor]|uniref:Uncharacterized protein n=1 Tax=Streptomyces mauvecolor TaxID=58345 RepID=A0ABV9UHE3_9ACTN
MPVWHLASNLDIPNERMAALLVSAGVCIAVNKGGRIVAHAPDVVGILRKAGELA